MTITEGRLRPGRWIRSRVFTLGLFGVLASLGLMIWAGRAVFIELDRHARSERELRARLVAERVTRLVTGEMERLELAAARVAALSDAEPAVIRAGLRHLHLHNPRLFDRVYLLEPDGEVRMEEPYRGAQLDGKWLLGEAQRARGSAFTQLGPERDGDRRLYAVVPVRTSPGAIQGYLAAAIDPAGPALSSLLVTPELGPNASVDLVDSAGVVFASTDFRRRFLVGDHAEVLSALIRDRRSSSGACHGCHPGEAQRVVEEFAFSPVALAPWGVNVRQAGTSARAFEGALAGRVSAAGLALVVVMLLFAYGASLSVTRPVEELTAYAERVARGELNEPVPLLPLDEVGRLGAALERMRVALKESLSRIEEDNVQLEARVEERTRELEKLYAQLKLRDASRAEALRKVISAQEDERRRIARELHDETSQSLAALAIRLESLARSAEQAATRDQLAEASSLTVRTLEEVHRICVFLRPSVLDDLGLASAIQWYADRCFKDRGVSVRCEASGLDGLDGKLPPEVETALFRCAQEAMTNIARHAQAETVLVECGRRGEVLTLAVEDDGKGFDPASVMVPDFKGRGLGLLGIRERVDLLGGEVKLDSSPGEGTRIAITIPLPQEEASHVQDPGHPR